MALLAAHATALPAHSLLPAQEPTLEQERTITDALFRERTVELSVWNIIPGFAVPALMVPWLCHPFVAWPALLGWEVLLAGAVAWFVAMRVLYARRYPRPTLPANGRIWSLARHGFHAYVSLVVGLSFSFYFFANSVQWDLLASAGSIMVLVLVPNLSHERGEVLISGILQPLPVVGMLVAQGTPLHYSVAGLLAGIATLVIGWGMHQLGARRNEILLRLALHEEKGRAEQANLAKSKFLAAASHDLRQPLHALTYLVEALEHRHREDPTDRQLIQNIGKCVVGLQGLFNSLLDISRLDAGAVVPVRKAFPLALILSRLETEFRGQAEATGLEWRCECDDVMVHTDPVLLETVLRNLISNAFRYTREGSVRVSATVGAGGVRIEVRDTGIGIPADQQQEVFGEFVQLHNPERDRGKGLGLGLAIVKRISQLLDHPLELESQPGRGSVFTLVVSLSDAAIPFAAPVSVPTSDVVRDGLRGRKVLVIDNERDILDAMQLMFEMWGCRVTVVLSGEQALEAVQSGGAPDVIVSDLRLAKGRSGIDVIHALREAAGAEIPGVIISGDTAPSQLRQAAAAGFQLLHKPVIPSLLRATVVRLCSSHHEADSVREGHTVVSGAA